MCRRNCEIDFSVPYQLKTQGDFQLPSVHSVFSGIESIKFLGSKNMGNFSSKIKQLESLKVFNKAIKQWKPTLCLSRLCKTSGGSRGWTKGTGSPLKFNF